jgi:D-glycero-D-manno-heptose 1,7-bisphosphate phosphatase
MKNKALFLDRDGILNAMILQESGEFDSPQTVSQITIQEEILPLITYCNQNNILVLKISNQPGAAKNKMSLETLLEIDTAIDKSVAALGGAITQSYLCLHHPNAINEEYKVQCTCRKPKPGLLLQAAQEHNLDLSLCVFLGDNVSDAEAAVSAGCTPVLYTHLNDEPKKIEASKNYTTNYKITSLTEALPLIKKLL